MGAQLYEMDSSGGTESIDTSRKTGWFPVSDLAKKTVVRRLNARYSSAKAIDVKVYADGDDSAAVFSGTLRANNGDSVMDVGSGGWTNSATSVPTSGVLVLNAGDFINVESETMKVISTGSNTLVIERAKRGTSAAAHSHTRSINYANHPLESLRVGKRAKYLMVGVEENGSGSTDYTQEIGKLEVEVDAV